MSSSCIAPYHCDATMNQVGADRPPPLAFWAVSGVLTECIKRENWLPGIDYELDALTVFKKFIPAQTIVLDNHGNPREVPFWSL